MNSTRWSPEVRVPNDWVFMTDRRMTTQGPKLPPPHPSASTSQPRRSVPRHEPVRGAPALVGVHRHVGQQKNNFSEHWGQICLASACICHYLSSSLRSTPHIHPDRLPPSSPFFRTPVPIPLNKHPLWPTPPTPLRSTPPPLCARPHPSA